MFSEVWFEITGCGPTGPRLFFTNLNPEQAEKIAVNLKEEIRDILKSAGSEATVKAWAE